jgi:hypothetical protein
MPTITKNSILYIYVTIEFQTTTVRVIFNITMMKMAFNYLEKTTNERNVGDPFFLLINSQLFESE